MPRKLNTDDVPQADDLQKVLRSLTVRGYTTDGAARALDVVPRQVAYYRQAARILGYLDAENSLTRAGEEVLGLRSDQQFAHVLAQFSRSDCGSAWIRWSRATTLEGVRQGSAEAF